MRGPFSPGSSAVAGQRMDGFQCNPSFRRWQGFSDEEARTITGQSESRHLSLPAEVTSLLGGPHDLPQGGLRTPGAAIALGLSTSDAHIIVARCHGANLPCVPSDGARSLDFSRESVESACSEHCRCDKILPRDQPHRPDRRPAFSLAVQGWSSPALPLPCPDLRQPSKTSDEMRFRSLRPHLAGPVHEQIVRVRYEGRQVDDTVGA